MKAKIEALSTDDLFWVPKVIRTWVTKEGRGLDAMLMLAWSWMTKPGLPFPQEVEFLGREFSQDFERHRRSTVWINYLEAEGLIEVLERRTGPRGGYRVRVLDPELVKQERRGTARSRSRAGRLAHLVRAK